MKLTPSFRVCVLGAILFAALWSCSRNFSRIGDPSFLIPLAVAGVAYLLAMREFFVTTGFPRYVIIVGLALSALWHLGFLRMPPGPDDDIHRYIWDGRIQRLGYNPYVVVPSDPAVGSLHTPETRELNNPNLPSPYPPGAQLFFRAVTAIHESVLAMKMAFVVCDLAIMLLLLDLLRRSGQGPHWVLAYAWHPLLATEVAGSGHIDIVGALLLVASFAALARRWRTTAAVAFGLAVAVKFLPIVLLPLYWKRVRIRDGALAAVAGFLTAVGMRRRSLASPADSPAWPMAASLLCAPVIYPWYLLWLLPFLRSASTLPIIIWTVSIIPTYYVWHLRALGRPWLVPGWVMLLEYGAVVTTAAIMLVRRLTRPAMPAAAGSNKQSVRTV